jgi:hypothetical protein
MSDRELAEIEVADRDNLWNFRADLQTSCMKSRSSGGSGGKRMAAISLSSMMCGGTVGIPGLAAIAQQICESGKK